MIDVEQAALRAAWPGLHFPQFDPAARKHAAVANVTAVHCGDVVRGQRVGQDADAQAATHARDQRIGALFAGHEIGRNDRDLALAGLHRRTQAGQDRRRVRAGDRLDLLDQLVRRVLQQLPLLGPSHAEVADPDPRQCIRLATRFKATAPLDELADESTQMRDTAADGSTKVSTAAEIAAIRAEVGELESFRNLAISS